MYYICIYIYIYMYIYIINAYSVTLLRGEGQAFPAIFWALKKVLLFWERKGPDCVHQWITFFVQNVVLRLIRRENSKMFSCRVFFSYVFGKNVYESALVPLPWTIFGCTPAFRQYSFSKTLRLKCFTLFFRLIQAPCITYSQPCHSLSSEPETYSKPYETLTRHIQKSLIVRTVYSGIIQNLM